MAGFTKKSILILALTMILFAPVFVSAQLSGSALSEGYHTPLYTRYIYNAYTGQDFVGVGQSALYVATNAPVGQFLTIARVASGPDFSIKTPAGGKLVLNQALSVTGKVYATEYCNPTGTVCNTGGESNVPNCADGDIVVYDAANGWTCTTPTNPLPTDSVWAKSGTNAYYADSGNVGIGTSTPTAAKLQVNGDVEVWGDLKIVDSNSNNIIYSGDGLGSGYYSSYFSINGYDDSFWRGLLLSSQGSCTTVVDKVCLSSTSVTFDTGMDLCSGTAGKGDPLNNGVNGDQICTGRCSNVILCYGASCSGTNPTNAKATSGTFEPNSCANFGTSDKIDCTCKTSSSKYSRINSADRQFSIGAADGEIVFASSQGNNVDAIPTSSADSDVVMSVTAAGDLKVPKNKFGACSWIVVPNFANGQVSCTDGQFLAGIKFIQVAGGPEVGVTEIRCCLI